MDEYEELLKEINLYLELDDVVADSLIISAAELVQIVSDKYELLRRVHSLEEFQKHELLPLVGVRKLKSFLTRRTVMPKSDCHSILLCIKPTSIKFVFFDKTNSVALPTQRDIEKEFGKQCISCETEDDKIFLSTYYETIMERFLLVEQMLEMFYPDVSSRPQKELDNFFNEKTTFSDSFLNFSMNCFWNGNVRYEINVGKEADPNGITEKLWLDREPLNTVLKNNKYTILEKIPIFIDDLPLPFQRMVAENRKKQSSPLVKQKL